MSSALSGDTASERRSVAVRLQRSAHILQCARYLKNTTSNDPDVKVAWPLSEPVMATSRATERHRRVDDGAASPCSRARGAPASQDETPGHGVIFGSTCS